MVSKKRERVIKQQMAKDVLKAISDNDNDMENGFKKGLSLGICVRCFSERGTEEERADFVIFSKRDGHFYCPEKVEKDILSPEKVFVNQERPPAWCPYVTEHAVSRKG